MQFIDECVIFVKAGDGGDGCIAFRRAANQPRGGPCGGNGGRGGSILIEANQQFNTLHDIAYRKEYRAPAGQQGQGRDRHGHRGDDILIHVPVGTLVKSESGELLCDLSQHGQQFVAAKGGLGGFGNLHYASSTNQAPHRSEPGTPGEERRLILELQLLADVGLIGYPNAGKSSLLSMISAAKPKIANYPFTTLIPQLGVIRLPFRHPRPDRSMVIADIPGLIEGAHEGKGLGLQFLRHIQRTRALIHLLDIVSETDRDPWKDYKTINQELFAFKPELAMRPQVVAINKMDLPDVAEQFPHWQEIFSQAGIPLYGISTATGAGISDLLEKAYFLLKKEAPPEPTPL